mgnify:CR=1 FL=1
MNLGLFIRRKGSVGDESTSTLTKLLLALAFAAVASGILFSFIGTGSTPQFAIIQDFTGGLAP